MTRSTIFKAIVTGVAAWMVFYIQIFILESAMDSKISNLTDAGMNNFSTALTTVEIGALIIFGFAAYADLKADHISDKLVFLNVALLLPLAIMWDGMMGNNTTRALIVYLPYVLTLAGVFLFYYLFQNKLSTSYA